MNCNNLNNADTGTEDNTISSVDNPACAANDSNNIPLPRDRLVCNTKGPLSSSQTKETKKQKYSRLAKKNHSIDINKLMNHCDQTNNSKNIIQSGNCVLFKKCY